MELRLLAADPCRPMLPLLQNPGMSAMHLFRAVLVALSNPKTFSGGLFMQRTAAAAAAGSQQSSSPPDAKAWRRAFPVVFVDASGWLNLAAHVSKSALAQVGGVV